MEKQPHIFISYKRGEGERYATQLEQELASLQIPFWQDVKKLRYGEKWSPAIDQAINDALALIVVLTPGAAKSAWVTYEWSFAMGKGIPVVPIVFLPVDSADIHGKLSEVQFADYLREDDDLWPKLIAYFVELLKDYSTLRAKYLLSEIKNTARTAKQRKDALREIQYIKNVGRDVIRELLDLLNNDDHHIIHQGLIIALGHLGDEHAIADLVRIAEEGQRDTCQVATYALGLLGDSTVAPTLTEFLKSDDEWMRSMAAEALGVLEYDEATDQLTELVVNDSDWFTRWKCAEALGKIGNARAVEPLITSIDDMTISVCAEAIRSLGKLRDERAVSRLINALNDNRFHYSNLRICDEAVEALLKIPSESGRRAAHSWLRKQPLRKKRR